MNQTIYIVCCDEELGFDSVYLLPSPLYLRVDTQKSIHIMPMIFCFLIVNGEFLWFLLPCWKYHDLEDCY